MHHFWSQSHKAANGRSKSTVNDTSDCFESSEIERENVFQTARVPCYIHAAGRRVRCRWDGIRLLILVCFVQQFPNWDNTDRTMKRMGRSDNVAGLIKCSNLLLHPHWMWEIGLLSIYIEWCGMSMPSLYVPARRACTSSRLTGTFARQLARCVEVLPVVKLRYSFPKCNSDGTLR